MMFFCKQSFARIMRKRAAADHNGCWGHRFFLINMDSYRRVTSDQLREELRTGHSVLILDLRSIAEFDQEHIAGSLSLPLENFEPAEFLKEHRERPVVLLSSTGREAYVAAEQFYKIGFFDLKIVAGGLLAWKVLGFPLVKKESQRKI